MLLVGFKHGLRHAYLFSQGGLMCIEHPEAADKSTHHGEQGIHDREPEDEQRNDHCKSSSAFLRASDGCDSQYIADHQTSRITQKDRCRIEIVREKTKQGAKQNE